MLGQTIDIIALKKFSIKVFIGKRQLKRLAEEYKKTVKR